MLATARTSSLFRFSSATFASYTALDLGGRVTGHARRMRRVAAAMTMGGGIWATQFVAILAFRAVGGFEMTATRSSPTPFSLRMGRHGPGQTGG